MWTCTSFQLARCASLQRNMRVQRSPLGISSKLQVKCKLPKSTWWDTSTLSCQMANTRSRSLRPSQGPCKTRMQSKSNQATTRSPLIPEMLTSKRTDAASVEIPTHLEVFTCPAKRYQRKSCHKYGHFTSLCFMKGQQKQAYHKPFKPKAHQLTAGTIQAYDSQ